ncbi:hypothetical protein KO528_04540 [Saccharophagus degradans]|uniref:PA14 domain-containing protein n=1 Tax=Saccharophagus degradans TaxID=86304 RepID=UPI001C0806FC|nr:PA14 domain-containing protein [Saccharophagus degradans]MBU2984603.1 hypothetical protein [Saccharophagus degradans]
MNNPINYTGDVAAATFANKGGFAGWLKQSLCYCVNQHWFAISAVIALSTIANFILVFGFSEYQHYLTSDMHGYWERAVQIYVGDEKTPNTWVSNAPFYPRVIAGIFTWLNLFGLNEYRLDVLLSINILISILGTLGLYMIGQQFKPNTRLGLYIAGAYAFSYPTMYFNTFLLGEPFAIPLIIFSIALLFKYYNSYKIAYVGVLLAFAVGVRPSNGLLGLPFGLYILFAGISLTWANRGQWIKLMFPRCLKAGAFSLGFLIVIIGIIAENYRISDGKLRNLTAHSGYNFFLGQSQSHKIVSRFEGLEYGFVPSPVANHPEYGTVFTTTPIYDSKAFYQMGWDILHDHPHLYWSHLLDYKNLYFDNLFPAVPSVWGFNTLYDPFRYVLFILTILCGLLFIPLKEKDIKVAHVAFFTGSFVLCAGSLYFFTITHQYFQNFSYIVYVLGVTAAWSSIRHYHKYRKGIFVFCAIVGVVTVANYTYQWYSKTFYTPKIEIVAENSDQYIYNLYQDKKVKDSKTFTVNNLEFFQSEDLLHGTLGELGYKDHFYLTAKTVMHVEKSGSYTFTFYVDDGYDVQIDGKVVHSEPGLSKLDEGQLRFTQYLLEGKHDIEIRYFENGVFSGLLGYYKRADATPAKTRKSPYVPRGDKGVLIGDDSEFTRFELPN